MQVKGIPRQSFETYNAASERASQRVEAFYSRILGVLILLSCFYLYCDYSLFFELTATREKALLCKALISGIVGEGLGVPLVWEVH